MKQLIALSQKNKQNRVSTSKKFHFKTCASEHKLKLTFFHDSLLLMIPVTLNK